MSERLQFFAMQFNASISFQNNKVSIKTIEKLLEKTFSAQMRHEKKFPSQTWLEEVKSLGIPGVNHRYTAEQSNVWGNSWFIFAALQCFVFIFSSVARTSNLKSFRYLNKILNMILESIWNQFLFVSQKMDLFLHWIALYCSDELSEIKISKWKSSKIVFKSISAVLKSSKIGLNISESQTIANSIQLLNIPTNLSDACKGHSFCPVL